MTRKAIALIVLNLAAAAAVGLIAGLLYKGVSGTGDAVRDSEDRGFYSGEGGRDTGSLLESIASLAGETDAEIGVAAIFSDGDVFVYPEHFAEDTGVAFPLMSVMKFHQALAVCGWLRENGVPLETRVNVTPEMLKPDTWSPLREKNPLGGSFSYAELLEYTLGESDNNACDILFSYTGMPGWVDSYIRSYYGISDFRIECTEEQMHENLADCYRNWTTPLSAALLLEKFFEEHDSDVYMEFLWKTMSQCRTGLSRIPGHIADRAAMIVHKTGTGDITEGGRIMAVNDIGIVVLPDGSHFSLAVFIHDAGCPMSVCESVIASIAQSVFMAARI